MTCASRIGPVAAAAAATCIAVPYYAMGVYLPAFNTPHTPLEGARLERSAIAPAPPLARRIAFVLLDGLSFDEAMAMPELAWLRDEGVIRPLRVEFPSFTSPAIVALLSGAGPRDSGVRLNGRFYGIDALETVPLVAADRGVPVVVRSREWEPFEKLVRPKNADVSRGRARVLLETAAARAIRSAAAAEGAADPTAERALSLTYVGEIDEAAHEHGRRSAAYDEAKRTAAALVARIAGTLDPHRDLLVVASDHGHLEGGGHGGVEPEILRAVFFAWGARVRRGAALGERPMRDVAPTLAAAVGVESPASSLGRPMLDVLAIPPNEAARAFAPAFDQAARLSCRLRAEAACDRVPELAARLERSDAAALGEADALLERLAAAHDRAHEEAERDGARTRLAAALALSFALVLGLAVAARRSGASRRMAFEARARDALYPALQLAVYAACLFAFGYRPTFSRMVQREIFLRDGFLAVAAGTACVALAATYLRPGRHAPWLAMLATAIPFAVIAAWAGCDPAALPPPLPGILVFQLGPVVVGTALSAVVIAWMTARAAKRPDAQQEAPASDGSIAPRAAPRRPLTPPSS